MRINDFWKTAKELSPLDIIILMAVDNLANNDVGYCFANDETIGEKLDRHKSTINKSIGRLIKKGFLYRLRIDKGSTCIERRLYTISGYKQYTEDKETDIIKTLSVKKEDGTYIYINERTMEEQPVKVVEPEKGDIQSQEDAGMEEVSEVLKEYGHKVNKKTVDNIIATGADIDRLKDVLTWGKAKGQGMGSMIKALKENWITAIDKKKIEPSVVANAGARKPHVEKKEISAEEEANELTEADILKHGIWKLGIAINKRVELLSRVADLEDVDDIKNIINEYKGE